MSAELFIYDEIGPARWGLISAKAVTDALAAIGSKRHVTLRLNTPGGDFFEAVAIREALRRHPGGFTAVVDALAASAGSFILSAAPERQMAAGSHQMVHGPHTMVPWANKNGLREEADKLERFESGVREAYAEVWKGTEEQLDNMMAEPETWFDAEEALEFGLATEVLDAPAVAANLAPDRYRLTPKGLKLTTAHEDLRARIANNRLAGNLEARKRWLDVRQAKLGVRG